MLGGDVRRHTLSIAFLHLPPDSARTGYEHRFPAPSSKLCQNWLQASLSRTFLQTLPELVTSIAFSHLPQNSSSSICSSSSSSTSCSSSSSFSRCSCSSSRCSGSITYYSNSSCSRCSNSSSSSSCSSSISSSCSSSSSSSICNGSRSSCSSRSSSSRPSGNCASNPVCPKRHAAKLSNAAPANIKQQQTLSGRTRVDDVG